MPISIIDSYEQVYVRDRQQWRDWLTQHHATSPGVWLIMHNKSANDPCVSYDESVQEALCFGWIDSTKRKLDSQRSILLMTVRKKGSPWSKTNKERIERLLPLGLITEAGLQKINQAEQDGSWSIYDDVESLTIAPDIMEALNQNPEAYANFEAAIASLKKSILWWIVSAKTPQTRNERIAKLVSCAAGNENPLPAFGSPVLARKAAS